KEKLLPKISEYNILKENKSDYTNKLKLFRKDLLNDATLEEAESLLQEKPNYEHRLKQIEQQKALYEQERKKHDEFIHFLEWNTDDTKDVVLPFYLASTWEQLVSDQNSLSMDQKRHEEEQHLLKEKRINLKHDEKEINQQRVSEDEKRRAEQRLAADQSGRETDAQKRNYESWKSSQLSRSKTFAYISIATISVLVILGFLLSIPVLYVAAFVVAIGSGFQHFYAGTQRETIENMLFTGENDMMLSREERTNLQQLLENERTLEKQLSDIDHALRENNLLEIQAEEQQQILNKRFLQLDDRMESERFMYPFLQGVEVVYWPELLQHVRNVQQLNQAMTDIEEVIAEAESNNAVIDEKLNNYPYANNFKELGVLLE